MSSETANDRFLAVIPARGGSKRLPGKNLRELGGKPLIAWTIQAGLGASRLDEVVVSTDSVPIAQAAGSYGASVPFTRPSELSTDHASSFEVAKHAIEFYRIDRKRTFEYLVLLQPTSPFRTAADIEKAIDLLVEKNADAVVSVCETDHSPLWANTLPPDLSMRGFIREEVKNRRSQDLPKHYRINGAIYICKTQVLLDTKGFFPETGTFAYIMGSDKSIDIDDELHFKLAEACLASNPS